MPSRERFSRLGNSKSLLENAFRHLGSRKNVLERALARAELRKASSGRDFSSVACEMSSRDGFTAPRLHQGLALAIWGGGEG